MTELTDPYTEVANVVAAAVEEEFGPDHPYLDIRHDRIHGALATDGRTYVGISPGTNSFSGGVVRNVEVLIQFYGPYSPDVNPGQQVDPRLITAKATRLLNALRESRTVGTSTTWFFNVTKIEYPNDGTGNKTRFEMTIESMGQNMGLMETNG